MKTKNIKVAYTNRYPQSGCITVPKIQIEGKWLEELGFTIGSTVMVEYEEGSIRIRPLTEEELAIKKQEELRASLARKTAELKTMEKSLKKEYGTLSIVAECHTDYTSSSNRKSRKHK